MPWKHFRFSLLELLWACGVLAVFLGLNLSMSPLECGVIISHGGHAWPEYDAWAGCPAPWLRVNFEGRGWSIFEKLTPAEDSLRTERDQRTLPGLEAGSGRPTLEYAWKHGQLLHIGLLINMVVILFTILSPIVLIRIWKRKKQPAKTD